MIVFDGIVLDVFDAFDAFDMCLKRLKRLMALCLVGRIITFDVIEVI